MAAVASYGCERCGAGFARKQGLQRHNMRKRPCSENLAAEGYKCSSCGKMFSRADSLVRYAWAHCHPKVADASASDGLEAKAAELQQ